MLERCLGISSPILDDSWGFLKMLGDSRGILEDFSGILGDS